MQNQAKLTKIGNMDKIWPNEQKKDNIEKNGQNYPEGIRPAIPLDISKFQYGFNRS